MTVNNPSSQQNPQASPLIRALQRLRTAFWQRRVLHWAIRTLWIALLVPTIYLIGFLWLGWSWPWWYWVGAMILVMAILIGWAVRPIAVKNMVYRLDQRLRMQTRLITAYEVLIEDKLSQQNEDNLIINRLMQKSVETSTSLRRRIKPFNYMFWLEMQALLAIGTVLSALLMLQAFQSTPPEVPPVDIAAQWEEPTAEDMQPPPEQEQPQPPNPQQQLDALEIIAEEFRGQAATRPVSEAIDRRDLPAAAENLRRLADRIDQLSLDSQTRLGDAQERASIRIGDTAPEFTEPLERGDRTLDANDLPGAAQALEDLADVIENTNDIPPPQQEPPPPEDAEQAGGQMGGDQESQAGEVEEEEGPPPPPGESNEPPPEEEERLDAEGDPLELENEEDIQDDRVTQETELDADAESDRNTEDSPFAKQSLNPDIQDLGPDPLAYPWEQREVIRRYFTQ